MKKKEKTQLAQAMAAQRKAQEERQARKDKPERTVTLVGWKQYAVANEEGYYDLRTEDTGDVPVRLFLTPKLLAEAEDILYAQIVNATQFPGVKMVVITPDVHYGYGVPVGSVILTDGTLAMGPVGYDIGCGMVSARSNVPWPSATPEKRLEFNKAVMRRVAMGAGHSSKTALSKVSESEFNEIVRGGAEYYISKYGARLDRSRAERNRIPVDDDWDIPWGGRGRPERGRSQLGSLGGGNHFMELQRCEETGTLFVQVHSGSRGFGHGLATNYFDLAKAEKPDKIKHLDMGYFTPDSPYHRSYLNAVAAGGNFAIVNRLVLYEQIAEAFEEVFGEELELIYEISHNLVQREPHPELGEVWVHRKGATRAFPAGHPNLEGTIWEETGHPVLIPGSNRDYSFILRPLPGAVKSGFSVNHGAGRRLSRGSARRGLDQKEVNRIYRESGVVVNANADVPLDESDACYKSSQEVVDAVVQAGLAEIQYHLWPLASLKGTD
ncbi:MAG: RtcB family protein [Chloroflexota bacterium]|nr:RtcB family protein [Chloroflexota bacterium]